MTSEKKRESGFEQDLEKLEAIVETLEEGGLPLEKSLKQFETGIQLTRRCEKALRQAEQKIEMLVRGMDGELEARPFDADAAESGAASAASSQQRAEPKKRTPEELYDDAQDAEPPYDDVDDEDMDALF